MIRRLLFFLIIVGVGWLIRRMVRRPQERRPVGAGPSPVPRTQGEMVRDRVCNTFLPRSRALSLSRDGEDHFFCSEACREAFIGAGQPAASS